MRLREPHARGSVGENKPGVKGKESLHNPAADVSLEPRFPALWMWLNDEHPVASPPLGLCRLPCTQLPAQGGQVDAARLQGGHVLARMDISLRLPALQSSPAAHSIQPLVVRVVFLEYYGLFLLDLFWPWDLPPAFGGCVLALLLSDWASWPGVGSQVLANAGLLFGRV